jgi:broad specificity phosphatase PhoE
MTRILLIRHGTTGVMYDRLCGRTPGISLSELGRREAEQMSRWVVREHTISSIYSSPLERASETAGILSQHCAVPVCAVDALNEVDCGSWTGTAFCELNGNPEWSAYNRIRSITGAPGGEDMISVQQRAWTAIQSLSGLHPGSTIAVVSHGDVIRSILLLLLGMPLDHILRLEIAPASASKISLGGAYPIVHYVNRICTQLN